jgi:hypothetical protein
MRASCDYHPWYPNVDPEFDEMGGELTLHQISDPLPAGDEEPASYLARKRARDNNARYYARSLERAAALQAAKNTAYQQIEESRHRLAVLVTRFDRAALSLNKVCNSCIPYNGYLTPNYWSSARAPYRVEDYLR